MRDVIEPSLVMEPGVEVTLADGNTYVFPPLALLSLQVLQPRLATFMAGTQEQMMATITLVAMHSLRRNYPTITRKMLWGEFHDDEDGDVVWDRLPMLTPKNMHAVMDAVMDVSGVKYDEQQAKKAQASSS